MKKITIWDEFRHEIENVRGIYSYGLHAVIAAGIASNDFSTYSASERYSK